MPKIISISTIKDLIKTVSILLIGIVLTTASFLVYYLVEPKNWIALSVLFVLDFLYAVFNAAIAFRYESKWLLKTLLIPFAYILIFIAVPTLALTMYGAFDLLRNNVLSFITYAFFTAPCLILIFIIVSLIAALVSFTTIYHNKL